MPDSPLEDAAAVRVLAHDLAQRITNEVVPLALIDAHPQNYNTHPPAQLSQLQESYQDLDQFRSFILWRRPGGRFTIVGGEGTITAMRQAGAGGVRADVWPEETPPALITRIMLADNLHARNSVIDEEKLALLLQEERQAGRSLTALGTDEEELRQIMDSLRRAGGAGGDDGEDAGGGGDDGETSGEEQTRVLPGDVWALGRHRVGCLDALDEGAVARLLAGQTPAVVVADPPYGISIVSRSGHIGAGKPSATIHGEDGHVKRLTLPINTYAPVIGDDTTDTAVAAFALCRRLFPQALALWWGANHYCHGLPGSSCWIVWDKENGDTSFADCELAWCSATSAVRLFRHMWNGMIRASELTARRIHPTQKPVALFRWFFERYGSPGDLIYDPFLGSAPSLIAAEQMGDGRTVFGCELSATYVDKVLSRWEVETGQTATLLSRTATEQAVAQEGVPA